ADEPGVIVTTRKDSPIIVGHGADGSYVASDAIAVIEATRDVVVLADGQIAKLTAGAVECFDSHGRAIEPEVTHISWNMDVAEKGGYPDFMLKEIHEQPRVIRDTLAGRLVNGQLEIDELDMSPEELNLIDRVYVIACGTSYHAGLIAKELIEGWARIPTEVEVASEFRYRNPIITPTTLVVAVSQSGETADTLAAIRDARIKGARVFGITNVLGSPVARESDGVIYTKANKEIAVASTKSFLGQVVSLTLLAMLLAQAKGKLRMNQIRLLFRELADTAEQVESILADTSAIEEAAHACVAAKSALFIGRGMGAAIAKEGALKLKEISYLHAEAYPAGEMKHGPIALIDEGFPVIAVATASPVYDKVVSNLQESKARGAHIVAVATEGDEGIRSHADHVIYIPKVNDKFSAITASVPLQLLARAIAVERGCDVDQPRNLAKSVTVE
ncbi:MAG: glutamine--fructose-6-phosphate transaminase (isomerizing), partial [Eggerthellaceae bacterium]|nr:glutamine--fructose-6-phosphate transaminase (isomerizing) [Eggerthellaceae bacterium]